MSYEPQDYRWVSDEQEHEFPRFMLAFDGNEVFGDGTCYFVFHSDTHVVAHNDRMEALWERKDVSFRVFNSRHMNYQVSPAYLLYKLIERNKENK